MADKVNPTSSAANRRNRRASPCEVAFARYCAEENLVEDYDAPHWYAFYAGFYEGVKLISGSLIGAKP